MRNSPEQPAAGQVAEYPDEGRMQLGRLSLEILPCEGTRLSTDGSASPRTAVGLGSKETEAIFGMIRVGIGHDTHRLAAGRPLVLGGVRIEHDRGLVGHSDADIVLHAVTDALLGAAGLGDIGDAFPDTDPAYKDCDSRRFVRSALDRLNQAGWKPVNLDVIIFAQEPKLGPLKTAIRTHLAQLLGLEPGAVNVKAKTGEKVGAIGRAEALGCQAVVLIESMDSVGT